MSFAVFFVTIQIEASGSDDCFFLSVGRSGSEHLPGLLKSLRIVTFAPRCRKCFGDLTMIECMIHGLSAALTSRHFRKCLALPGGRSRPGKSFPFMQFALIVQDVGTLSLSSLQFDIALAGDVLEHLEQEEAVGLVHKIQELQRLIIATVPIKAKHWAQDPRSEQKNPLEKHRFNWTIEGVLGLFPLQLIGCSNAIGVFSNLESLSNG